MKHKVPWNRTLLEDFIKEGLLTEDEEFIMRTRLAGWSQVKQAMERNISTATVSNIVKKLKTRYNELSEQFPDRFPPIRQNDVEDMLEEMLVHQRKFKQLKNTERKLEKCKIFKKTIYKVNNLYYN